MSPGKALKRASIRILMGGEAAEPWRRHDLEQQLGSMDGYGGKVPNQVQKHESVSPQGKVWP